MRRYNVAFATIAASFAIACGQGTPDATAPASGAAARRSTIGMFLSRANLLSQKDGADLAKACAADAKKACPTVASSSDDSRKIARCLRDHAKDLSARCRDAIKKMRHDKDADDACAGACVCPQTCVAENDEDHGDKDKDKDEGERKGSSGKGSLRVATRASTSHDASHDGDHDDDDLSCAGACPAGMTACDDRCVDLRSDPDNCGRCDNECEDSDGGGNVCNDGKCAARCAPTLTNCTGACVDERIDPQNCGACGLACGCGQVCSNGICVTPGACVQELGTCASTADCCPGLGLACLAGVCTVAG